MTVAQLIAALQGMPQDAEVVIQYGLDQCDRTPYAPMECAREDDAHFEPLIYVGKTALMNAYPHLPLVEEWRRARGDETPHFYAVVLSFGAPDA